MSRLHERIGRGEHVLWVDYVVYAERLLAPGGVPWIDTADAVAWFRQAQGLLGSDVVTVPLWPMAMRLVAEDSGLREQMRQKTRVTHVLRTLLASDAFRKTSVGLVRALRAVFPVSILALSVPSPRAAITLAHRSTIESHEVPEMDEDDLDTASLYLADFVRGFGDVGLDVLLLEDTSSERADDGGGLEWCRPVLNTARHYGWDVGWVASEGEPAPAVSIDFVINRPQGTATHELTGSPVHVSGLSDRPDASFTYLPVPRDAIPEHVLDVLARIRSGAGR